MFTSCMVGATGRTFENEYPAAALLRTWVTGRSNLLLDEPLVALDALTRKKLQNWLLRVWQELGRTEMFITLDVEEVVYQNL